MDEEEIVEPTEPVEPSEPTEPEEPEVDPDMGTFGVLGYVTLEEADAYVAQFYVSTNDFRLNWEALSSADKAALLMKSFQTIEMLPFAGRKTCCKQSTAFPRWPNTEVPDSIKFAQIEQALNQSDASADEDARHYEKLWQWGVNSYTIGNLSEHLSEGGYGVGAAKSTGITSATATRLLAPFLQGGYSIR